ncbi:MAG: aldose epimerase family protein [Rhodospirillales bacterium]|jgi:aldose 1-epimerase|nr:aldose epimerase family protein [Rhodospirillales bacterium]
MGRITRETFGEHQGLPVSRFTLESDGGLTAKITDYGGILTEMHVPDRNGRTRDVVLGFDDLASYLGRHPFFGALVGRYANRIGHARFMLDGRPYRLAANQGPDFIHHLHGGTAGFDKKVWDVEAAETTEGPALRLRYVSPDGEEGYPGTLTVEAVYTLGADYLDLAFAATTDKATVINLVNHTYWNLAGHDSGSVLGHTLRLTADAYTPTDAANIPTGEIVPVAGTPYDFRTEKPVGRDMAQLAQTIGGYDVNFVLNGEAGRLRRAAILQDPVSGRTLELSTTAPGVQLYAGFKIAGLSGKGGATYGPCAGLCLETQHFPDSPNRPEFPSTVLRPGEIYGHRLRWRFSHDD